MTPAEVEAKLRENAAETAQGWSDRLMLAAADALSAQAVELERMREALGFLAAHPALSLQAVESDIEGEPMEWAVYRESGGRSDREFRRVSQAATPLAAILLARQALQAGGKR